MSRRCCRAVFKTWQKTSRRWMLACWRLNFGWPLWNTSQSAVYWWLDFEPSYETCVLIGCLSISWPIRGFVTEETWEQNEANEWPQTWSGLIVNSSLEAVAIAVTKSEVLGVNLQVIKVKELKFDIHFKKNSLKRSNSFEQNCDKSVNNSCSALSPCRVSLEMGWFLAGVHCRGRNSKILQEMCSRNTTIVCE